MDDQATAVEDRVLAAISPEQKTEQVTEEAPQEEVSEVEPEQVEETSEDSIELDFDAKLFEVEVAQEGGTKTKEKLSLNDLKSQRMMQADYQRKTQELAKERNQAQEAVRQQVSQAQGQYLQNLQVLEATVQKLAVPEMQNVDLNRMAQEDPAGYIQLTHRLQSFQSTFNAIQQEKARVQSELKSQQEQQLAQAIQQAQEELPKHIPEWGTERYQAILKLGVNYGFSGEEVGNVVDPRIIRVLNDAYQWHQLQAGKSVTEKKVLNVPKVIKPGAAPTKVDQSKELSARVRKTAGKDEDALTRFVKQTLR